MKARHIGQKYWVSIDYRLEFRWEHAELRCVLFNG
jgi:hypothetical protein